MEEIEIENVTKRSIRGVIALAYRTFTIQVIGLIANFLLTVFLSPSIFGIFFVVSAAIAFLSYFSDIGLAAALIQKKEAITDEELRTTFTIQQILVVSVVVIAFFLSGFVKSFYRLDDQGILLFQALVVSFFLSSLKTVPSIILERNLRFEKLVIPQIVENLFFYIIAVVLAAKGFGVASFTFAVLARGISGVITIYIINPWKMRFGFQKIVAKRLLSFGLPFQTNSVLALIKDDLLIVYLGRVLPLAQVGYIGFAQKWAFMPLRLIMDNVIRVTFPSFSRLQNDKEVLTKAIEKSIFAACFLIFPSLVGLVVLAPYFIHLVPNYIKWEPALLSLTFFSLNAALSSVSTPLTNALNAIGKIKITLYLMIFWTVSTWIITPLAIIMYGFSGVSYASAFIALSVVFVVIISKRFIKFAVFRILINPFLAAVFMGGVIYLISPLVVKNIPMLIFMIVFAAVIYFSAMLALAKNEILSDIRFVRENLKK